MDKAFQQASIYIKSYNLEKKIPILSTESSIWFPGESATRAFLELHSQPRNLISNQRDFEKYKTGYNN